MLFSVSDSMIFMKSLSLHLLVYFPLSSALLTSFIFFLVYAWLIYVFLLKDALELDQLISYLINKENSEGVILLGHSTGCQVCYY
jgi:hypothetical protein